MFGEKLYIVLVLIICFTIFYFDFKTIKKYKKQILDIQEKASQELKEEQKKTCYGNYQYGNPDRSESSGNFKTYR